MEFLSRAEVEKTIYSHFMKQGVSLLFYFFNIKPAEILNVWIARIRGILSIVYWDLGIENSFKQADQLIWVRFWSLEYSHEVIPNHFGLLKTPQLSIDFPDFREKNDFSEDTDSFSRYPL